MICKECGTQLPDIAKFCYRCGKTVGSVDLQDDFDPFGTDDGLEQIKKSAPVVKKEETTEEVKEETTQEEVAQTTLAVEEVAEEVVEEIETQEEAVAPVEEVAEETEEAKTEEATSDETDSEETDSEEEGPVTQGFKIMRNPDYVPPEVEEEKPFYEEHVNYEEIREQRAAKMEKRMQILSIIIGVAVLIGIGFFAYTKYVNHVDYTEKYDAAQALFDAGDYEGAFAAFGELVEHKGADEEEMVCKQYECLEAIGDVSRARDFAYNACRKYSSPEIRALLDAATSSQGPTAPTATVAPTIEPTDEPAEPTVEPSAEPTVEPTVEPSQQPDEPTQEPVEPTVEPDQPDDDQDEPVDYTAYEDTFAQLYTGMETLKSSANPLEVIRVMITEEFAILRDSKQTVAYVDGAFTTEVTDADNALILYENGYVYFGTVVAGKATYAGVIMTASRGDSGISYYFYRGVWENGCPNGAGYIEKLDATTGIKECTSGKFAAGYYDGDLTVTSYKGREEISKETITCSGNAEYVVEGIITE